VSQVWQGHWARMLLLVTIALPSLCSRPPVPSEKLHFFGIGRNRSKVQDLEDWEQEQEWDWHGMQAMKELQQRKPGGRALGLRDSSGPHLGLHQCLAEFCVKLVTPAHTMHVQNQRQLLLAATATLCNCTGPCCRSCAAGNLKETTENLNAQWQNVCSNTMEWICLPHGRSC
jgi:hypothetical protein